MELGTYKGTICLQRQKSAIPITATIHHPVAPYLCSLPLSVFNRCLANLAFYVAAGPTRVQNMNYADHILNNVFIDMRTS